MLSNHFFVETVRIDAQSALDLITDDAHGAVDVFIGKVRNLNVGRDVLGVTYDVFDALALNTFARLADEARVQWGELNIVISHFKGRLAVGGVSILIAVSAKHRDESFRACRFLIEEIKREAPIWKQEHYTDGDSEWVQGHALCQHDKSDSGGHSH